MLGVAGFCCGAGGHIPNLQAAEELRLETVFSDNRGRPAYGNLAQGTDGWLYGTTPGGGVMSRGTVFRVSPVTGELVTLGSFNGENGSNPNPGMARGDDGSWYGTTDEYQGDHCTIFRISPDGKLTTMVHLSGLGIYEVRAGLIRGSDGNFYGAARSLEQQGSIFRMTPGGEVKTMAYFRGTIGVYPQAKLVEGSDGYFYGTTQEGGVNGQGTAFRMSPSGNLSILASLPPASGNFEISGLVEGTDGQFYGTKAGGGAHDAGMVFKIAPTGGLTTVFDFNNTNGSAPASGLIKATDGSLYGSTRSGGLYQKGTIFKIPPVGSLSIVTHFNIPTPEPFILNGGPLGDLVQATDGNFYGLTLGRNENEQGALFRMTPAGALTTVATFHPAGGAYSTAPLLAASDGFLYGTAKNGGENSLGSVFKVSPSGSFSRMFSFTGLGGAHPTAGLIQAADGHFYGTTSNNGSHGDSLFRMTAAGDVTFFGDVGGSAEHGATLLQLADGNFYGTLADGGDMSRGMVYRVTPAGLVTTLHSFDWTGHMGLSPYSPVIQARDGFLYGTTHSGGAGGFSSFGTVYRISPEGGLTTMLTFDAMHAGHSKAGLIQTENDDFLGTTSTGIFKMTPAGQFTSIKEFMETPGSTSRAELIQGEDGFFYGTTWNGGTDRLGSVFRMNAGGEVTTLASFHGTDGRAPTTKLVQGADGQLYGTTEKGGTHEMGTIYRVTTDGTLTSLHSFNGTNGAYPKAGLAADATGAVYGMASSGGLNDRGTVFKMTPQGSFGTLVDFDAATGHNPVGGLLLGRDGNFYGAISHFAPPNIYGTIFKMTPDGTLTVMAGLAFEDPSYPLTALIQDPAGNFLGTTTGQNSSGSKGTVFKMTPAGQVTQLASFDDSNNGFPSAALVPGPDGNLYGTTVGSPSSPTTGTIFRVTPQGAVTRVLAFPTEPGHGIPSGLMLARDGLIYGTTQGYGRAGGTVFSMNTEGILKKVTAFSGVRAANPTSGLVKARDGNYYGVTPNGGDHGFGMIYALTPGGVANPVASFDGISAAAPKGPPILGPDGDLYGTADQLVIWRLAFPPVHTKPATLVTGTGALLHGTVNPKNNGGIAAGFQFGTHPGLLGAATVTAGSVPDGGMASGVSAVLTHLTPGTVYYFRASAGGDSGQTGNIQSFQTLTHFQSWRMLHFGTLADAGNAAVIADPDGDGISNVMEFAVGSAPHTASPPPIGYFWNGTLLELRYSRNVEAIASGFQYIVEWSDDLDSVVWSQEGVKHYLISNSGAGHLFKAVIPSGTTRRYARLKVRLP